MVKDGGRFTRMIRMSERPQLDMSGSSNRPGSGTMTGRF